MTDLHSTQPIAMFQRQALLGQHSIERVFADIRSALSPDFNVSLHTMPHESRGIGNRLRNLLFVSRHRNGVCHIVGDIHYAALALPRAGTILTVHDLGSIKRLTGIRKYLFILLWYRLPIWRVQYVTVVSQWTRAELAALLPRAANKIVVIHNPVSPAFRASPPPRRECPLVLQIGTGPNKNLTRVIQALRGLEIHLRIIGQLDDEQVRHLSDAALDFSNVVGISDEQIVNEYASSDIVIFVSTYEGFGLPILEAQAAGRPVITSSFASMPEIAGEGAIVVDPLDTSQIRAALRSLIEDPGVYDSIVKSGFLNVARFRPPDIAAEYADLYRQAGRYRGRRPGRPLSQHAARRHYSASAER